MTIHIITSQESRDRAIAEIGRITSLGPTMAVEIKRYVKNRSKAQNRLYWSWLQIMADHIGHKDKEETHDLFRMHFLGTVDREVEGVKLREIVSTTTLTTDQFTTYLEKILRYANQENIRLPMDDEFNYAMGTETNEKEPE